MQKVSAITILAIAYGSLEAAAAVPAGAIEIKGNPNCQYLTESNACGSGKVPTGDGYKMDDGPYGGEWGDRQTCTGSASGKSSPGVDVTKIGSGGKYGPLSFSTEKPVYAAIMKAGRQAWVYCYKGGSNSGKDLRSPYNKQISHVEFCWDESGATPVAQPVDDPTPDPDPIPPPPDGPPECMQDVFQKANSNTEKLTCRADEIFFETLAATGRDSCKEGSVITVSLEGSIRSKKSHGDAGFYVATDGGNALTGTCHSGVLTQNKSYKVTGSKSNHDIKGEVKYEDGDQCGDIAIKGTGGASIKIPDVLTEAAVTCTDDNGDGSLDISVCFTWRDGADHMCDIAAGLFPAEPMACFCRKYQIPQITVIQPEDPVTAEPC